MLEIADIFIMDVGGQIENRDTKHCVCIAASQNKFFVINTQHRTMYDDFMISAADYDFLKGQDRFVCCSAVYKIPTNKIIRKVGKLKYADMLKLIDKIQNSVILDNTEKSAIIPELTEWQLDNS